MNDSRVSLQSDLRAFFREPLEQALASHAHPPSPAILDYLVGLLADSAKMDARAQRALTEPLPFALDAALRAAPHERFEELRGLGDQVLLLTGFFPEHLPRAGIEEAYAATVGARAYRSASALLGAGAPQGPDVLAELAQGFRDFAALLQDVAVTLWVRSARSAEALVELCERWVRGGSEQLGRMLRARGVLLPRGAALLAN